MRIDGISALVALVAGIVYGLNSCANKQISRGILKICHRSSSYRVGRALTPGARKTSLRGLACF
jgi:hypothetical protein